MFGKKRSGIIDELQVEKNKCPSIVYNRFYLQMNKLNLYMHSYIAGSNNFESEIVEIIKDDGTNFFPMLKLVFKEIENRSGSYIAIAEIEGVKYKCVVFFCKKTKTIEIHLIGCQNNDLLGRKVKLYLIQFIREWQEFKSEKYRLEAISNDVYLTNFYFRNSDINIDNVGDCAYDEQRKVQNTLF